MADKIDDGGPAFPVAAGVLQRGMTLRDWFAGQALAAVLPTDPELRARYVTSLAEGTAGGLVPATAAYQLADAMLAERQRGK